MKLYELLNIKKGITTIIGSGGKSTLIYTLAHQLSELGTVLVTTTTHILDDNTYTTVRTNSTDDIKTAFETSLVVCVGTVAQDNKLSCPTLSFDVLSTLADFVLVEADGSRRLPLKVHADYEPVIPRGSNNIILVLGIDAVGKKVQDSIHRYEFAKLASDSVVDVDTIADIINTEALSDMVVINKCDEESDISSALQLSQKLNAKCILTSLSKGEWYACSD